MTRGRCGVIGLLIGVVVFGCAPGGPETGPSARRLRLGVMPKLMGISYFDATGRGAREAAEELGLDLTYDGPTEARSDDQAKMLHGWVAQGLDILAVAPNDPEAIATTLRDARQAGLTVLTWDTDANPGKSRRQLFVNQADNRALGQALVDTMAEGVRARHGSVAGKFLIVSGTPTASNQNAWIRIMRERIAEKYPEMELLPILTPGEDQRNAQEQSAEAIAAHAELKGIWGITSVALPAAARAVQDAGQADAIYVTGLSLPSLMAEYVRSGVVEKFVLWDAVDLGYLTVHVAARLHRGPVPDGTHDFGRLRGIEVRGEQVLLGPPLIFDKENLERYSF